MRRFMRWYILLFLCIIKIAKTLKVALDYTIQNAMPQLGGVLETESFNARFSLPE